MQLHYNNKKGKLERCRCFKRLCPFGGPVAQTQTRAFGGKPAGELSKELPMSSMGEGKFLKNDKRKDKLGVVTKDDILKKNLEKVSHIDWSKTDKLPETAVEWQSFSDAVHSTTDTEKLLSRFEQMTDEQRASYWATFKHPVKLTTNGKKNEQAMMNKYGLSKEHLHTLVEREGSELGLETHPTRILNTRDKEDIDTITSEYFEDEQYGTQENFRDHYDSNKLSEFYKDYTYYGRGGVPQTEKEWATFNKEYKNISGLDDPEVAPFKKIMEKTRKKHYSAFKKAQEEKLNWEAPNHFGITQESGEHTNFPEEDINHISFTEEDYNNSEVELHNDEETLKQEEESYIKDLAALGLTPEGESIEEATALKEEIEEDDNKAWLAPNKSSSQESFSKPELAPTDRNIDTMKATVANGKNHTDKWGNITYSNEEFFVYSGSTATLGNNGNKFLGEVRAQVREKEVYVFKPKEPISGEPTAIIYDKDFTPLAEYYGSVSNKNFDKAGFNLLK